MPKYYTYRTFREFERDLKTIPSPSIPNQIKTYLNSKGDEDTRLSRATKQALNEPTVRVKDRVTIGPKADLTFAALSEFRKLNADQFSNLSRDEINRYRALRQAPQEKDRATPAGGDKRRFDPTGKDYAVTRAGSIARYAVVPRLLGINARAFAFARATMPCIQRTSRREVMFASGRAGKGYRIPHRRNSNSDVEC